MAEKYVSPQSLKNTLNDITNFMGGAAWDWEAMPPWVQDFLETQDENVKATESIWATLHRAYRHAGSGLLDRVREVRNEGSPDNQTLNFVATVAQDIYDTAKDILLVSKTEVRTSQTRSLAEELVTNATVSTGPERIENVFNDTVQRYPEFFHRIEREHGALLEQLRALDMPDYATPQILTEHLEELLNRFMFEQHDNIPGKVKDLENKIYADTDATPFAAMAERLVPSLSNGERDEAIQLARQIAGYSFIGKYGLDTLPKPLLKEALKYEPGSLELSLDGLSGIVSIGAKAGEDFEDICAALSNSPYSVEYGLLREGVAKATTHVFEQLHAAELVEKLRVGGNTNEELPQIERILSFLNEIAPEHDPPSAQHLALVITALASHLDGSSRDGINAIATQIAETTDERELQAILTSQGYRNAAVQLGSVLNDIPSQLAETTKQARKILTDSIEVPSTILVEPRMATVTAFRAGGRDPTR